MRNATPNWRNLTLQLLSQEVGISRNADDLAYGAVQAFQRLRQNISPWIGIIGFDVLLTRTLYLSTAEFSFLIGVQVAEDGEVVLTGLNVALQGQDHGEANLGVVSLLANFFWLLSIFIGPDLALRQVRKTWPELTIIDQDFGIEESRE